jgi:hypothetical protein
VHYAVSAEAVCAEESGDALDLSQDGVVVGRDFVESGPGAFWVDREVLEYGNAIRCVDEDFLDEGFIE